MAKVTAGPLAGLISGKVGNVVFARGRYGPYIRSRVIPTLVTSDYTDDVRGRLGTLAAAWGVLDTIEKEAWRTYAATNPIIDRLGASRILQPSAWFIKLNARILQAGGTQIDVPWVTTGPADPVGPSIVALAGAATCIVTFTAYPTGESRPAAVWLALMPLGFQGYYRNRLKLVKIARVYSAKTVDCSAEIALRFGAMVEGQHLYCECEAWNKYSGLISSRVMCETVVAA
jgi:hypothetical protein